MIISMLTIIVLIGGLAYYAGLVTGRHLSDKVNMADDVNQKLASQVEALHDTIVVLRREIAMKDKVLAEINKARRPTPGTQWL